MKRTKRIQLRVTEEEYNYFQYLKDKDISITKHILNAIKLNSELYRKYSIMINGYVQ